MKKLCAASIAALLVTSGAPLFAQNAPAANVKLSKAECSSIWGRADAAGAGLLTSAQAQPYVSDVSTVDANADGKLSSAEFMSGCQKGLVHDSANSGASDGSMGAEDAPAGKKY